MTEKKVPMRRCVGCGEMKEKKNLIRIIRTPEGEYMLDKTLKANGRGAYICNDKSCFEKAVKNNGLQRSFSSAIPADIISKLKGEFENIEK